MIVDETLPISELAVHFLDPVNQQIIFQNELMDITNEQTLFSNLLEKPFQNQTLSYEFRHSLGLEHHILYNLIRNYHSNLDFLELSKKITTHLLDCCDHPNIRSAHIMVARLHNFEWQNASFDGIGIYKFDDKEVFLETNTNHNELKGQIKEGFGSKKADKSCLILFRDEEYTILNIEKGQSDSNYWSDDFLGITSKQDFVHHTHSFLNLTKDFITKQLDKNFDIEKADKIDFLNRSVSYFKNNERFEKEDFVEEVFQQGNIIDAFNSFNNQFQTDHNLAIDNSFEISEQAVKKQTKIFKSVLKLDKNFHVYIHGNRNMIEKGTDSDGRKFYKIYYENED